MDTKELKEFHSKIIQFSSPEELFGEIKDDLPQNKLISLNEIFKDLIKTFHPDKFNKKDAFTKYLAGEISSIINGLYAEAKKRIEKDIYGKTNLSVNTTASFEIKTKLRTYKIFEQFLEADYADLYMGEFINKNSNPEKICVKIMKDKADNDLLRNEIFILRSIQHKSIPVFIDQFRTTSGELGLIERFIEGSDLITIRDKFTDGIPVEHMCWILDRLLSVLGYLHYNKIIHGNIEPGNIIVRPSDHNVFLIDYLFSIPNANTTSNTYSCFNESYSAPEVALKKKPIPSSDLFSLGKSMLYLMGGDVETDAFPSNVDKRIQDFLLEFLNPNPIKRVRDAWQLWHRLSNLREEVFGARHQFLELIL
ncbi:MAG TPA: protein kinase [Leptospiraceae bacterium]|nr:protein kinase [Leptospiraceae bacterium]HMW03511.1 protein kinase [Leptospiraceae bacterium]HMX33474.1 protein kinase [Leptospiraceae bacterium]HMY29569.1 protein kinase [Leptospiraceae bacterium]HMZ62941.1 protein kinase [Leptospiraceae bacterium]